MLIYDVNKNFAYITLNDIIITFLRQKLDLKVILMTYDI